MIKSVKIGNRLIGPGNPPFIIAEACINHEGDIKIAEKMVHAAKAAGADCIKFQIHVLENEMLRQAPQSDNFDEPLWNTLERTNLSTPEHKRLKKLCEDIGIVYLCTPFSRDGADILEKDIGADFYKTGSGEMTNLPLIEHIAKFGKPMIVSTGMSTIEEIRQTVDLIKNIGTDLILTHCISVYPTPPKLANIGLIPKYRKEFSIPVGLSDHSNTIYTALGAVALGACVIEKHFTLDKAQRGPDHASSIEPGELEDLVKGSRAVFEAMGEERKIYPEEGQIVAWAREAVVSETDIAKGTKIAKDMVWVKRPSPSPGCIGAKDLNKVIGKVVKTDIAKNSQIKWSDIE
jgi:sialic acid synthase SpsE